MTALPSLTGLRAFDAAGRRLSFRAAAEELGLTQGAVAQQIRALEAQLDTPLFDRHARGVTLTDAGRRYHGQVQAGFDILRQATQDLQPTRTRVRISVTPSFAAKWLIPNLPDLTARLPDLDVQVLATELRSSFHADGIDLAVRQERPPFGASLDAYPILSARVIAVAAPEIAAAPPDVVLRRAPRIHDTHSYWPAFADRSGVPSDTAPGLRLSQTALAIDAARAGQGVALAPHALVAEDLLHGRLEQIGPWSLVPDTGFYLLAPRGARRAAVTGVIDWFLDVAAPDLGEPL